MNDSHEKFVEFHLYCPICKYGDLPETEDPCNECLGEPVNMESHKPVLFQLRGNNYDETESKPRKSKSSN